MTGRTPRPRTEAPRRVSDNDNERHGNDRHASTISGPPAPVAPGSRLGAHLLGVVLALALGGGALYLLATAAARNAAPGATDPAGAALDPSGVRGLALACLLLAIVAYGTRWSTLGAAILGGLLLGAGALALASPVPLPDGSGAPADEARAGALLLLEAGLVLTLGAVLLALAAGVHGARRAGRAQERLEAALDPARSLASTHAAPPVPPRSRAAVHVTTIVAGLLLVPIALVVLRSTAATLALDGPDAVSVALHLLATLALALVAASVRFSSVGAQVSGALWLLAGGYLLLRTDALPGVVDLGLAPSAPDVLDLARTGVLPVLGAALLGGGLGAHEARRAGRRHERAEIQAVLERETRTYDA